MSDEAVQPPSEARTRLALKRSISLRRVLRRLCISLWLHLASVECVHAGQESNDITPSNQPERLKIELSYEGATEASLCIPANLDYSLLPDDQSATFLVRPMSDGTVHFLYKREPRSFTHVEQVSVAIFSTSELWKEILGQMRTSPEREELSGFVFKTVFRTDGSQTYVAASKSDPVNLLIHLRNDGANRELRKAQLSSIASSASKFLKKKECN